MRQLKADMTKMRAVIVKDGKGPIENLYVGEIEKPSPRNGEVLVQVSTLLVSRCDGSETDRDLRHQLLRSKRLG